MLRYLSIDVETTGLNTRHCQMIELAAVLEDRSVAVDDLPYFQAYVRHDLITGEYVALRMNAGILPYSQEGSPQATVEKRFRQWMNNEHGIHPGNVIPVAGKNVAGFDLQFLSDETKSFFHHRAIDPGSLFVDWTQQYLPGLSKLVKHDVKHNALDDARDVIRVLRKTYDVPSLQRLGPA